MATESHLCNVTGININERVTNAGTWLLQVTFADVITYERIFWYIPLPNDDMAEVRRKFYADKVVKFFKMFDVDITQEFFLDDLVVYAYDMVDYIDMLMDNRQPVVVHTKDDEWRGNIRKHVIEVQLA